jgi:hypothetical protein
MHEGIMIVLPDDNTLLGDYDGYGRVYSEHGTIDIHAIYGEYMKGGDLKSYLEHQANLTPEQWMKYEDELRSDSIERYFNNQRYKVVKALLPEEYNNEKFDDLGWSTDADGQGFWYELNEFKKDAEYFAQKMYGKKLNDIASDEQVESAYEDEFTPKFFVLTLECNLIK